MAARLPVAALLCAAGGAGRRPAAAEAGAAPAAAAGAAAAATAAAGAPPGMNWFVSPMPTSRLRSHYGGDVGYEFEPLHSFSITALGRGLAGGKPLSGDAAVTLWHVSTKKTVAFVTVGKDSPVASQYAYVQLQAPVPVEVGERYRVSQVCTKGMADQWYDNYLATGGPAPDVRPGYATMTASVYGVGHAYPDHTDGELRRQGMVTFWVASDPRAATPAPGAGGGAAGCGGGCAFLIVVFVGGFVYFAGGVAYNWRAKGLRGAEAIPHVERWRDLPSLVKDGVVFAYSSARSRTQKSYTSV